MNKLILTVIVTLLAQFGLNTIHAQQETLTSSTQKQCAWNSDTQNDENCENEQKEYEISVNKSSSRIHIVHPSKTTIFKIISTEEVSANNTVFKTIEASGQGRTITYNSSEGWIKVAETQPNDGSMSLYYYINN